MRSTTSWSALLLALGVALAPAAVQAQPGVDRPADPQVPLPLYHPRADVVGGWYTGLEYVMFRQTNPIGHQLLAVRGLVDVDGSITGDLNGVVVNGNTIIRGPIVPGNFIGTGNPALYSDDLRGQETYQPGYRLSLGYRFNSGASLEANYMALVSARYTSNVSLIPTNYANLAIGGGILSETFLFSPFFNLPPEFAGPNQELAIGNPGAAYGIYNGALNMSIAFTQRYDEFNIKGRVPWYQDECTRIYGIGGGRFAWIWEDFHWRTVAADFTGFTRPEDVAVYANTVSNRMYGPFVGIGAERYLGRGFGIGVELEAAALLDIVKERAFVQNGDRNDPNRGTSFVKIKKAATNFAMAPETNANVELHWYPIEGIQVRAGWNFMSFFNTIAAEDPVAFDARSFEPDWKNKAVRFFDGFNVGVGFIY
jgi:hypothetical protein